MKMLRCFGIHVLVKILNLEISCFCLADYVNGNILKFVSHVQHDYFSSFNLKLSLRNSLKLTNPHYLMEY